MDCKWVKQDGAIIRLAIIWFGYPNTEEKSLPHQEWNRRQKSLLSSAVSNTISCFWQWKRTWIMFTCSLVHLPGFHPRQLRDCLKVTRLGICERSFHISRNCVEKNTYGQAHIMLEQQEVYQQRLSDAIFLNAKESRRKANRARFHPNPLKGDGTSRVPFVKRDSFRFWNTT